MGIFEIATARDYTSLVKLHWRTPLVFDHLAVARDAHARVTKNKHRAIHVVASPTCITEKMMICVTISVRILDKVLVPSLCAIDTQ